MRVGVVHTSVVGRRGAWVGESEDLAMGLLPQNFLQGCDFGLVGSTLRKVRALWVLARDAVELPRLRHHSVGTRCRNVIRTSRSRLPH